MQKIQRKIAKISHRIIKYYAIIINRLLTLEKRLEYPYQILVRLWNSALFKMTSPPDENTFKCV